MASRWIPRQRVGSKCSAKRCLRVRAQRQAVGAEAAAEVPRGKVICYVVGPIDMIILQQGGIDDADLASEVEELLVKHGMSKAVKKQPPTASAAPKDQDSKAPEILKPEVIIFRRNNYISY